MTGGRGTRRWRGHRLALLPLVSVFVFAAMHGSASAATSCSFVGTTLTVQMSANADTSIISRVGDNIRIQGFGGGDVSCGATTPTVTTVDTIAVDDVSSAGATSTHLYLGSGVLAPGATTAGEGSSPEIELNVDLGDGTDTLYLHAGGGARWRFGTAGVNLNADEDAVRDADVTPTGIETFALTGSFDPDAVDRINASGGAGTGEPSPISLFADGNAGNDMMTGGDANDYLEGGLGDDQIDGGRGQDEASYANGTDDPVTVDLTAGTATGAGHDSLVSIESSGGPQSEPTDDTFIGNGRQNVFYGRGGEDRLEGRGEDDFMNGGEGQDTADYSSAPGGVQINLASNVAHGGAGNDALSEIERIRGSDFDDVLQGSNVANVMVGASGKDRLKGLDGPDVLNGGPGVDTVDYEGSAMPVTVDLAAGTGELGSVTDSVIGVENATGTFYGDFLYGDDGPNRLKGLEGGDELYGRGGNDLLDGGDDLDTCQGGPGTDDERNCETL